jgi:hypothetical protein
MIARTVPWGWSFVFYLLAFMAAIALSSPDALAKKGGNGGGGNGGGGGSSCGSGNTTTVSGTVTNNYGVSLSGASVTFAALTATCSTTTNGSGVYSIKVPSNASYDVSFAATNHATYMVSGSVLKGKAATLNAVLTANARVIVTASVGGNKVPGATMLPATGSYTILDGSTFVSSTWSQTPNEGVPATIGDPSMLNTTVTLGSASEYAAHLIQILQEPPITAADLPPDLNIQPINEINKGLQDRNQVVGIDPLAYERAEEVPLKLSVTTSSGTYSASANVVTQLPWVVNTGLPTVPVNVPVLLYAKEGASYQWQITGMPAGSTAALTGANTQTPWFTPDKITNTGAYRIQEMNGSGADLMVYVGRYHGVIDPILTLDSVNFGDGRPVGDPTCTGCHNGVIAPDNFATWRNTGHAEAFTQGITTNGHFGENCFACHAVGYDQDNAGGIDDAPNYIDFVNTLVSAQHEKPPAIAGLWTTTLEEFPDVARLSNIQCENCHGPQDYTDSHPTDADGSVDSRVKLGSEVCGSCHGEPARHGRYQQWLLSNHADYDLAKERGTDAGTHGGAPNCARCHSGNGFVQWNEHNFDPNYMLNVTWDEDTVVPQTCAACHNPHDTGTTSGSDETNAKVRVNADGIGACGDSTCNTNVLLAGFKATNVGKGATCMTCHNSRAGTPRNDGTWASLDTPQKTDSPHHGVQADLVMGQNLYFTGTVPVPGNHANIEDVCVTCHMDATQPPDILSYNQAGTNHTFAADPGICADCHGTAGETLADQVDNEINGYMGELKSELGAGWTRLLAENYPVNVGGDCGIADESHPITVEWVYGGYAGSTRLNITANGHTCSKVNPSSVTVGAGSAQDLGLNTNTGALYKAAWNYGLNFEDETINAPAPGEDPPHTRRGVHNHAFSQQGLLGAISAVNAVAP